MYRINVLALFLSFFAFSGVQGRIWRLYIDKDDRQYISLTRPFGYAKDGELKITVTDVKVYSLDNHKKDGPNTPKYDHYGFFLSLPGVELPPNKTANLTQHIGNCSVVSEVENVIPLFSLEDYKDDPDKKLEFQRKINFGGEYVVFFANCNDQTPVSFKVRIEMFNQDGNKKNYLSVGEIELPTVYFAFFSFYIVAGIMWIWVVLKQTQNSLKIHHLMTVLVLFKALTLLCEWGMYHYMRYTGHPYGWNVAYYVFTLFRGIIFFTVIVLVGTGWSYLKPFLGDNERRILMVVIPLQVFANIAIVVLDENSPAERSFGTWKDIFHLVDIVCCCAVLFPIVWSINHLRDAAKTDGKAAASIQKLALFRTFYIMVVVYIYFTRIVVYLLKTTVPYQYSWTSNAAEEMATLIFYVLTAVKFMPSSTNPYFALDSQDYDIDMKEMLPTSSKQ